MLSANHKSIYGSVSLRHTCIGAGIVDAATRTWIGKPGCSPGAGAGVSLGAKTGGTMHGVHINTTCVVAIRTCTEDVWALRIAQL